MQMFHSQTCDVACDDIAASRTAAEREGSEIGGSCISDVKPVDDTT